MYRYNKPSFRNINKVRICMMTGEHSPGVLPDPEYFPYLTTHPCVSKIFVHMLSSISNNSIVSDIFSVRQTEHRWFKLVTDIVYSTYVSEVAAKCLVLNIPLIFYSQFIRRLVLLNKKLLHIYVEYYIGTSDTDEVCRYIDIGHTTHHKDYLSDIIINHRILISHELYCCDWVIGLEGLHGKNLDIACKQIVYYSIYCPKYHPKLLEYTRNLDIHQLFSIYRVPPRVDDKYLSRVPILVRRWYTLNDIEPDSTDSFVVYCYIVFSKSNLFTRFNLHNTFVNLADRYSHKFNIDHNIRVLIMNSINRL